MAVEMEGAAIAQVCYEHDVPHAIVRTISDTADDHATALFTTFLSDIAGAYSSGVLQRFLGFGGEFVESHNDESPTGLRHRLFTLNKRYASRIHQEIRIFDPFGCHFGTRRRVGCRIFRSLSLGRG